MRRKKFTCLLCVKCVCSRIPAVSSYEGYMDFVAGTENKLYKLQQQSRGEESRSVRPFWKLELVNRSLTALWLSEPDIIKLEFLESKYLQYQQLLEVFHLFLCCSVLICSFLLCRFYGIHSVELNMWSCMRIGCVVKFSADIITAKMKEMGFDWELRYQISHLITLPLRLWNYNTGNLKKNNHLFLWSQ